MSGEKQFQNARPGLGHQVRPGRGNRPCLPVGENEKQVTVWPQAISEGKLKFPDFVKLSQ